MYRTHKFPNETNREKALRLYAGWLYTGVADAGATSGVIRESISEMEEAGLAEYGELVGPALETFEVSTVLADIRPIPIPFRAIVMVGPVVSQPYWQCV